MEPVEIDLMRPCDLMEAATVVGRAFASLPSKRAEPVRRKLTKEQRMTAMFKVMLGRLPGQTFVARRDQSIVGAMRIVKWPKCQLSGLMMVPFMIRIEREQSVRWLIARCDWGRKDPWHRHWHIAPLAVEPEMHGRGVGSQLMTHFCQLADEASQPGYLETDRLENVRLYERFGFLVSRKATILGNDNWFMWRPARDAEQLA